MGEKGSRRGEQGSSEGLLLQIGSGRYQQHPTATPRR